MNSPAISRCRGVFSIALLLLSCIYRVSIVYPPCASWVDKVLRYDNTKTKNNSCFLALFFD